MKETVRTIFNNLSIKSKFIVILIVIIGTATSVMTAIRANQVQSQMLSQIAERLQTNSDMSLGIIETIRIYTLWMLDAVANMPHVKESLSSGDAETLRADLAWLHSSMNMAENGVWAYANIYVFDADLNLLAAAYSAGEHVDINAELFARNIAEAKEGHSSISDVFKSPYSGMMQFLFIQPVMIDGSFSGVAAILSNSEILDYFLRTPTYDYDS